MSSNGIVKKSSLIELDLRLDYEDINRFVASAAILIVGREKNLIKDIMG
ncbi:33672_t:CDS:2 [Gigaspora margarita]|uniref:33672_t:CDS:1 n=1 Tax=Gigaspora margarita TaxID=4874 RepID=A0ABN7UGH0_GIGMA|nr:33672_t:CDS:2 [Gigaspora margarita]